MLNLRWMRRNLARWVPERLKAPFRARLFGYRAAPRSPGTILRVGDDMVEASFRGVALRVPRAAYDDLRYHLVDNADSVEELAAVVREGRTGGVLLDVGAARGLISAIFCLAGERNRAVALEPSPVQVRDARRLAEMNGIAGRMTVRPIAAGAAETVLRGAVDEMGLIDFSPAAGAETFPVEMVTVDAEVARLDLLPSVVKIDVEGHELEVLRGARGLLAHRRPILLLELHLDLLERRGTPAREIVEMLQGFGYRFETSGGHALGAGAILRSPNAVLRLVAR